MDIDKVLSKSDRTTGEFMAQKKEGKFKGVRREN
jgi:hypothetical protein